MTQLLFVMKLQMWTQSYCPKHDDETNFNEKKVTCKTQNFYILLAFLLITIALLIAVTI